MTEQQFLSDDASALLRRGKCSNLTDDQFAEFIHSVNTHRLDPLAGQIYAVIRNVRVNGQYEKRLSVQTGIDGFRLIADRTKVYAGNDDAVMTMGQKVPETAFVTVYKIAGGIRCPFSATARWAEYYPGEKQGMMWHKMPCVMLGKCAEALALRKAFPAELSGIYIAEEFEKTDAEPKVAEEAPPANVPPGQNEDAAKFYGDAQQIATPAQRREWWAAVKQLITDAGVADADAPAIGAKISKTELEGAEMLSVAQLAQVRVAVETGCYNLTEGVRANAK